MASTAKVEAVVLSGAVENSQVLDCQGHECKLVKNCIVLLHERYVEQPIRRLHFHLHFFPTRMRILDHAKSLYFDVMIVQRLPAAAFDVTVHVLGNRVIPSYNSLIFNNRRHRLASMHYKDAQNRSLFINILASGTGF